MTPDRSSSDLVRCGQSGSRARNGKRVRRKKPPSPRSSGGLGEQRGLAEQRVRPLPPANVVAAILLSGKTQEHGRLVPRERAPVQQPCCPSQERLLRLQRLGLASFIQQSDARDSAEERAGVKLHRSLAKALPVDHARTVAEINDVS